MAELQTRGHRSRRKLPGTAIRSFRLIRFALNSSNLECSKSSTASLQSTRQVTLSKARLSKLSGWICHLFNVALSWSLFRFRGLPTCRVPCSSSPKSNMRGIRVSSIRAVCPAQRRRTSIIWASIPRVWHLLALRCLSPGLSNWSSQCGVGTSWENCPVNWVAYDTSSRSRSRTATLGLPPPCILPALWTDARPWCSTVYARGVQTLLKRLQSGW